MNKKLWWHFKFIGQKIYLISADDSYTNFTFYGCMQFQQSRGMLLIDTEATSHKAGRALEES